MNEIIIEILQRQCDNYGLTDQGLDSEFIRSVMFNLKKHIPELWYSEQETK